MSRKDSPQSVIDSYRRRQQMAPYFMAGLAILLVVVGIIILVVWFTGQGGGRVSPVSLFASATPTMTETATPTPVTPTATATVTPTVTMTPTISMTPTVSGPFEYTIQENDTCWDIAANNKVDITLLLTLNNFGTECPIKPGQKILIPAPDTELPTQTAIPSDLAGVIEYTVQFGDTLQSIAINYNTTMDAIIKENKYADASVVIKAGDKIRVPANTITATPTPKASNTPAAGAATETPAPSATITPQP